MQIHGTSACLLQKVVKMGVCVWQLLIEAKFGKQVSELLLVRAERSARATPICEGIINSVSKLENFDYETRIRKASEHTNVDTLSRLLFKDQYHRIEELCLVGDEVLGALPVIANVLQEALNNVKGTENLIDCIIYQ
uniref:Uncharacterized protein n=1 Tax=Glossina austeni TaxID=7395 RepID=A0A1A9UP27_GLOAU